MKTILRGIIVVLVIVSVSGLCWGDWRSELTKLGFYAIVKGKAIPLDFKQYREGSIRKTLENLEKDFPNIPILGKNDFLVLYGEMPSGPLGTTVEIHEAFKVKFRDDPAALRMAINRGEIVDVFSMIPMPPLNGQKVTKLIADFFTIKSGNYSTGEKPFTIYTVLHRYSGDGGDAFAVFGNFLEAGPADKKYLDSLIR